MLPERIKEPIKAIWNIRKAIFPLVISLSEKASEAYIKHEIKKAKVEAFKEGLILEIQTSLKLEKQILTKVVGATDEEKVRYMNDLEFIRERLNKFRVYARSIDCLQDLPKGSPADLALEFKPDEESTISSHWLDSFNEIAKKRNEPWREDLLAKALAMEASNPGAIGTKALWALGTLDEIGFQAFATFLDLSPQIGDGYLLPENTYPWFDEKVPSYVRGSEIEIDALAFLLADADLVAEIGESIRKFPKNSGYIAKYGVHSYGMVPKEDFFIKGIMPNSVGGILSGLYEQKPNSAGEKQFNRWLDALDKNIIEIKKLS